MFVMLFCLLSNVIDGVPLAKLHDSPVLPDSPVDICLPPTHTVVIKVSKYDDQGEVTEESNVKQFQDMLHHMARIDVINHHTLTGAVETDLYYGIERLHWHWHVFNGTARGCELRSHAEKNLLGEYCVARNANMIGSGFIGFENDGGVNTDIYSARDECFGMHCTDIEVQVETGSPSKVIFMTEKADGAHSVIKERRDFYELSEVVPEGTFLVPNGCPTHL